MLQKRKVAFCTRRAENGKSLLIPLEPQPHPDDLLLTYTAYQKLKASNNFTALKIDRDPSSVALFEYNGPFPGHISHGNDKSERNVYQRTNPEVLCSINDSLNAKVPPQQIYRDIQNHCSSLDARDLKQIQNVKYVEDKKRRDDSANVNFADQIQHITSSQVLGKQKPQLQKLSLNGIYNGDLNKLDVQWQAISTVELTETDEVQRGSFG